MNRRNVICSPDFAHPPKLDLVFRKKNPPVFLIIRAVVTAFDFDESTDSYKSYRKMNLNYQNHFIFSRLTHPVRGLQQHYHKIFSMAVKFLCK